MCEGGGAGQRLPRIVCARACGKMATSTSPWAWAFSVVVAVAGPSPCLASFSKLLSWLSLSCRSPLLSLPPPLLSFFPFPFPGIRPPAFPFLSCRLGLGLGLGPLLLAAAASVSVSVCPTRLSAIASSGLSSCPTSPPPRVGRALSVTIEGWHVEVVSGRNQETLDGMKLTAGRVNSATGKQEG